MESTLWADPNNICLPPLARTLEQSRKAKALKELKGIIYDGFYYKWYFAITAITNNQLR